MAVVKWKKTGLAWAGGVESSGPAPGSPPAPTTPPPGSPPPGTPPAPPATSPPVVVALQTFWVREDMAIGAQLTPLQASNNPTGWVIVSGNTNTTWSIDTFGRLTLLKQLNALTNGSYVPEVVASNAAGSSAPAYVVINITAAPSPPPAPGGGGQTGGVPNNIINLAPAPAVNQFTTGISTQETWPPGEWPSALRLGPVIVENNTWAVRPGWWEKTWIASPTATIVSGQFHQRVGGGPATSADTVSIELHQKVPGDPKPAGAPSEVMSYPSVGMGQLMAWSHRQLRKPANVPQQLQNVSALWVGAKSITTTGTTCKGHLSHDMRVGSTSDDSSTYAQAVGQTTMELMIVHRTFLGYGLGPGARPSGSHRGTVTIGGIQWYIHTQQGATDYTGDGTQMATLLCFVPTSGSVPDQFNAKYILDYCRTTRWNQLPNGAGTRFERGRGANDFMIQPTSWIKHDFFGFEADATVAGEVHITLNTAFYRMNLD